MTRIILDFTAPLRLRSNGKQVSSRHFVTVTKEVSEQIRQATASQPRRWWGALRVEARIGYVKRKTSIFPESKIGCYLLPVKKEVRQELHIEAEDEVYVTLQLLE